LLAGDELFCGAFLWIFEPALIELGCGLRGKSVRNVSHRDGSQKKRKRSSESELDQDRTVEQRDIWFIHSFMVGLVGVHGFVLFLL